MINFWSRENEVLLSCKTRNNLSIITVLFLCSCYSCIGRTMDPKGQVVSIGYGCDHEGIILHELMHTVGFFHTNSRPDRDAYVIVYTNNIKHGEWCI